MISDALSDAISEIDRCLRQYQDVYAGTIRESILEVRDIMHILRDELDTIEARPLSQYLLERSHKSRPEPESGEPCAYHRVGHAFEQYIDLTAHSNRRSSTSGNGSRSESPCAHVGCQQHLEESGGDPTAATA